EFEDKHQLVPLWATARPGLEAIEVPSDVLDDIEGELKELDRFDSGSYGFRYPYQTRPKQAGVERALSLPGIPDRGPVDILHARLEELAGVLDIAQAKLQAAAQQVLEAAVSGQDP